MIIKGLSKLLELKAPNSFKDKNLDNYYNRIIAINATNIINHFLSAGWRSGTHLLTNDSHEFTSHLQGMLIQTVRFLEAGIKPVYVFDGNPHDLEKQELAGRFLRRVGGTKDMQMIEAIKQEHEECIILLELMGLPVIKAPSEADAQCADLCKSGKVYAVCSEDMDSLAFGPPRILRILMDPSLQDVAAKEFEMAKILNELNLTMDQFIDFCILSGCDYCPNIKGIGGHTALKLIYQYGSLENVPAKIKERYRIPDYRSYQKARNLLKEPLVFPENEEPALEWTSLDEKGLMDYLVEEKGFDAHEIIKIIENIMAAKRKSSRGIQSINYADSDLFPNKWKRTRCRDELCAGDILIRRASSPSASEIETDTETTYMESQGSETPGPCDNPTSVPSPDPQPGDPTDLTGNPAKVNAVLHPTDGLWFDAPAVVHEVSHSFESYFTGPYTCWSKTPIPVRHKWWLYFKKQFSWDPSVARLVKKAYEKKLKRRLSGTISRLGLDPNSRADWCPPEVRAELMRLRASETFQKKSQQSSANRNSSQKAGRLHCQGSISTTYLKRKMAKELGREPTAAEVFKRGHQTKDGDFVDTTSAAVWEEYERLKRVQSESEMQNDLMSDDEIFFRALGGWTYKGTLYGLGSAADLYYDRDGLSTSGGKRHHMDEVKVLENKIEDINSKHQKEKDKQQEVITSQQKQIDQTNNNVKALQEQLEAMSQFLTTRKFGAFIPPLPCIGASLSSNESSPVFEMGDRSQSHLRSKKRGRQRGY